MDALRDQVEGTTDLLHEHAVKVFETHELALQLVDERSSSLDWPTIQQVRGGAPLLS